jgi:YD repeat-containing protein
VQYAARLLVRATGFNHVSVHAVDMEESVRFYTEVLGMQRVPTPNFGAPTQWLRLGDQQLHLFVRETSSAPRFHHIGLNVDDFEAAYVKAKELGIIDSETLGPEVRELPDGSVQMYLRDPAGNLVEIDWPDVSTLDHSVITTIHRLEDERPQDGEAARARLYVSSQTA